MVVASWVLLGVAVAILGLRVNLSSSMPIGLYRMTHAPITRGALVSACLPRDISRWALDRGYVHAGACPGGTAPLLKRVAAIPGDRVTLEPARIALNSDVLPQARVRERDSDGRELPHPPWGIHRVPLGEVWLLGDALGRSFDSRYFGPVRTETILSAVKPVLTLSSP